MQVAVVRTEYVEVPDALVVMTKAFIRNDRSNGRNSVAIVIIKSLREGLKIGLKEAKELYDALNAEVAKETKPVW